MRNFTKKHFINVHVSIVPTSVLYIYNAYLSFIYFLAMKRTLIILGIITLTFTVSAKAQSDTLPEVKTSDAFKQLQGIIGKWKGKLTKDNGVVVSIESEFSLTSNGSAIVERSVEDGTEMFTM